ncbi:MAG TPA: energy transducer TonB [Rhodoblastus sp.]|nr:energy transducer TonB [Rhodoblastus sp.]
MSVAEAQPADLLPRGLRVAVAAAACAVHVGALVALSLSGREIQVLAPLNVDLVPQGNYFVDTVEIAGPAAEPTPPQAPQESQPEPQPEQQAFAAPPPEPAAESPAAAPPDAPAPTARAPEPEPEAEAALEQQEKLAARRRAEAAEEARERRLEQQREERRRKLAQERREDERRERARHAQAVRQGGSQGHRAGVANGQAARAARASYGATIAAELNRHKYYPPAARARGETGSVGVVFSVGPSGRIVAHSISRSSGSAALDGAVHAMMARAHAPPPPGGSFRGSININFNLGR